MVFGDNIFIMSFERFGKFITVLEGSRQTEKIHTHTHTHTHTRAYIYIYIYRHTHIHTYIHTHTCIHIYTHAHTLQQYSIFLPGNRVWGAAKWIFEITKFDLMRSKNFKLSRKINRSWINNSDFFKELNFCRGVYHTPPPSKNLAAPPYIQAYTGMKRPHFSFSMNYI